MPCGVHEVKRYSVTLINGDRIATNYPPMGIAQLFDWEDSQLDSILELEVGQTIDFETVSVERTK